MVVDFDVANSPPWRALLLFKNDQFMLMLLLALHLPALLRRYRGDFYMEGALLMFLASLFLYGLVYGETRYIMPWVFVMAPFYAAAAAHFIVEPLVLRLMPSLSRNARVSRTVACRDEAASEHCERKHDCARRAQRTGKHARGDASARPGFAGTPTRHA